MPSIPGAGAESPSKWSDIRPDRTEADRFITAITGSSDTAATFQTFVEPKGAVSELPPLIWHGTLEESWDALVRANRSGHGVYVMVNEGDGNGRAAVNVQAIRALFVDDDENRLSTDTLPLSPTLAVRSKNGLHVYWRVRAGVPLDAFTPAQAAIAAALGTDPAVKDLPRVMRVPGFFHLKDRADPFLVRVERATDALYTTGEVLERLGASRASPARSVLMATNRDQSRDLEQARAYIAKIHATEGARGDVATYTVACALVKEPFWLDHENAWKLLRDWNQTNAHPPWPERDLAQKLRNAESYGRGELGPTLNTPATSGVARSDPDAQVAAEVAALNDEWFVLDESGKLFVCRIQVDRFGKRQRRERLVRYSFADFKRKLENVVIDRTTLGDAWLSWPGRRQYDRAVFDPGSTTTDPGVLNLWKGWAVDPAPGDWGLIRSHIDDVVCSGNQEHARYLIRWIAHMLQHPGEPGQVVPVLRGKEGAGKSVLGVAIRRMLGQHGLAVSNPKHVVGNFNAHLRDLLFLEASEAFFAGDRGQANQLKALITDDMLVIEAKGVDAVTVPNLLHVMMTTNEDWAVSAGAESRRYFVLDVSDTRRGNGAYFDALWAQVNDEAAIGAMLHDLLAMDLAGFDVRKFPVTEALLDQRARSATGVVAWAVDLADRGEVIGRNGIRLPWREFVVTRDLYEDFRSWVGSSRFERTMTSEAFGRALKNELGLEGPMECPRESARAFGLLDSDWRKPGYWVGTRESFEDRARRACGLSLPRVPSEAANIPRGGSASPDALSEGSEGPERSETQLRLRTA